MNNKDNQLPTQERTTLSTSRPFASCLKSRHDQSHNYQLDRRVSFPEGEENVVTGFLDPANPWEYADNVKQEDIISCYTTSCKKHGVRPLNRVIFLLKALDYSLDRNECLDLKGEILSASACETLEEILKRIQFVLINLESTNIDDESAVALFDMIEYYESAVRLNITGNHCIASRGWHACSRLIKRTKCLEELDARNTTLNEQFMPILTKALRLSPQLHVLKLENCNLSGRPVFILIAALKMNTGLKELYLGENYLMQNDALQLSSLLKTNSHIQLIDISNNNIQDEGLGFIVEGLLEQNTSGGGGLQVLILWNNHLSRKCGHQLSRVFTSCTSLETLNIGQNVLSNEVLHVNKLALQKNRSLLRLGMQSTHLTCEGAIALAEIIEDNPTIQRIDLRDNNLQVAGLMALALSVNVNKSVTQLDLDDMPRRKHSVGPVLDQYMRLVSDIRGYCERNIEKMKKTEEDIAESVKEESMLLNIERRPRAGSFATRKISLTCETLARTQASPVCVESNQQLLVEPKRTGGRLRSPAPSPIPSPVASPSPTRSRFQVSRVSEADSPLTPPSTSPNVFFGGSSRFTVTVVETNSPTIPTTILTSNNITVGFETSRPSVSPAPSPTPIPAPLLSSIPSLFPSPMPSPGMSPNSSLSYNSPFTTVNVNETIPTSPLPGKCDQFPSTEGISKTVPLILGGNDIVNPLTISDADISVNTQPLVASTKRDPDLNDHIVINQPDSNDIGHQSSCNIKESFEKDKANCSNSSYSAVCQANVSKFRSDSEESEKDTLLNRKLPKAIDSIDLSALRVKKQASVLVVEKSPTPSERVRKLSSWVQPSSMFSSMSNDDSGKPSSSLERLLGLFVNPFSRSKVEEEPAQQLERVLEVTENSTSKSDIEDIRLPTKTEICKPVVNLSDITPNTQSSDNVQRVITDNSILDVVSGNDDISGSLLNNSNKPGLKNDETNHNRDVRSVKKGCGLVMCDKQTINIPASLISNDSVKCKTWPQGTSVAQLNLIQTHSVPCLTALLFHMSSADIQKLPLATSDEKVDPPENSSLAL